MAACISGVLADVAAELLLRDVRMSHVTAIVTLAARERQLLAVAVVTGLVVRVGVVAVAGHTATLELQHSNI